MAAVGICRSCYQRNVAARCVGKPGRVLRRVMRARLFRYRAVEENFDRSEKAWTQITHPCRSTDELRRCKAGFGSESNHGRSFRKNRQAGGRRAESCQGPAGFAAGLGLRAWIERLSARTR